MFLVTAKKMMKKKQKKDDDEKWMQKGKKNKQANITNSMRSNLRKRQKHAVCALLRFTLLKHTYTLVSVLAAYGKHLTLK